jgi:hypothetical protein
MLRVGLVTAIRPSWRLSLLSGWVRRWLLPVVARRKDVVDQEKRGEVNETPKPYWNYMTIDMRVEV